ncbi:MAG: hypothetical protein ACYDCL_13655, partial [Myxococcales bacterium]
MANLKRGDAAVRQQQMLNSGDDHEEARRIDRAGRDRLRAQHGVVARQERELLHVFVGAVGL